MIGFWRVLTNTLTILWLTIILNMMINSKLREIEKKSGLKVKIKVKQFVLILECLIIDKITCFSFFP